MYVTRLGTFLLLGGARKCDNSGHSVLGGIFWCLWHPARSLLRRKREVERKKREGIQQKGGAATAGAGGLSGTLSGLGRLRAEEKASFAEVCSRVSPEGRKPLFSCFPEKSGSLSPIKTGSKCWKREKGKRAAPFLSSVPRKKPHESQAA